MKRRAFISLVGCAAVWPVIAQAQQPTKMKRIAIVAGFKKVVNDPNRLAFDEELKRLGYVEGENLIVDEYSESRVDRYDDLARQVVSASPDLIVSAGTPITIRLKAATNTIPIVATTGDPIRSKIVSNIARPGGNITGVSNDAGIEIWGKRLEILAEAVPKLVNVAYISTRGNLDSPGGRATQEVARKLGISLVEAPLSGAATEAEYRRVFDSIQRDQVDGIIFSAEFDHYPHRFVLVQLVQQIRLPAIHDSTDQVEAGGLLSYAVDIKATMRTMAAQTVKILNGANPGDMPYVQGARFELAINLKTAKSLGLELPVTLLARADRVTE